MVTDPIVVTGTQGLGQTLKYTSSYFPLIMILDADVSVVEFINGSSFGVRISPYRQYYSETRISGSV